MVFSRISATRGAAVRSLAPRDTAFTQQPRIRLASTVLNRVAEFFSISRAQ